MLRFAENFPEASIVATLSRQLGWSHFKEILYLKDELQRDCSSSSRSPATSPHRSAARKTGSSRSSAAGSAKTPGLPAPTTRLPADFESIPIRGTLSPESAAITSPGANPSSPEIRQTPSAESPSPLSPEALPRLSLSHFQDLIAIDDPWKRAFFENESLLANGSLGRPDGLRAPGLRRPGRVPSAVLPTAGQDGPGGGEKSLKNAPDGLWMSHPLGENA
jgi:hypothetical protein